MPNIGKAQRLIGPERDTLKGRRVAFNLQFLSTKIPVMQTTELKIRGNWNEVKGKLKQKYAELTDDDLKYDEGHEDELVGRIQKKTGETKEAIIDFIESL